LNPDPVSDNGRSAADTLNFGGIWEALNQFADFLFAICPAEARKLVLAVKTRIVLTYGLALNGNGAPLPPNGAAARGTGVLVNANGAPFPTNGSALRPTG
jgi:hypothetical protein